MENKKYLDKVIGSLVRSTKIESLLVNPLFRPINKYIPIFSDDPVKDIETTQYFGTSMYDYLKNQFGLIDDEVKYVIEQYIDVVKDKYKKHNNL